jgi:hypothetical protein
VNLKRLKNTDVTNLIVLFQKRVQILITIITDLHLNNSHGESCFFGQLLPDVSRRFRRLREGCLEDLQLLCLNRRPRASSLAAGALAAVRVVFVVVIILQVTVILNL